VVVRDDQLIVLQGPFAAGGRFGPTATERVERVRCRFRSLGCVPCSGAVRSEAGTVAAIIAELRATRVSERNTRVIDYDTDGSMERKKREGYF
jgi:sulfate adenylyltransferase subunit 2